MAGPLKDDVKEEIRVLLSKRQSIRQITKTLKLSRNTVRKLIRAEGLTSPPVPCVTAEPPTAPESDLVPKLEFLDFRMLEKMFSSTGEPGPAKDFEKHIKSMALDIGRDLGVRGRLDIVRLEGAVANYISWRRFYFMSLEASDKQYCGPFMKNHDKTAKAVDRWISASNRAFEQMNRLLRELELKYGRRAPDLGRNNIFVQNQQVNLPRNNEK